MTITTFTHPTLFETIDFHTPNDFCKWRIDTMLSKEPITIEWINSFESTDVFWDIGANIGVYSAYAAKYTSCKVYAFEPVLTNTASLAITIMNNNLKNITLYPFAISDTTGISNIAVYTSREGYGSHSLIRNDGTMQQGVYTTSIDDAVANGIPKPDHIKIDVDGIEPLIINGGLRTLKSVKSVLVEVDLLDQQHVNMVKQIEDLGFYYDPLQVQSATRKSDCNNYVFAEHLFFPI